jgi:hypothetical protein
MADVRPSDAAIVAIATISAAQSLAVEAVES